MHFLDLFIFLGHFWVTIVTIHFHCVEKRDMNILRSSSFCVLRHDDRFIVGWLAIPLIILADTEFYSSLRQNKIAAADIFFCASKLNGLSKRKTCRVGNNDILIRNYKPSLLLID